VAKLLELKADLNARDDRGATPLQDALLGREDAVCELLLEHGAALGDLDVANALNTTAAANDTVHLARLLKFRCDVNAQDAVGRTPLHLATASFCVNATSLLLDVPGIEVNCEDAYGNTPLDDATREDSKQQRVLVALLESRGARPGSHVKKQGLIGRPTDVEERREKAMDSLIDARNTALLRAKEIGAWLKDEYDAVAAFKGQLEAAVRLQRERGAVLADELPELWTQIYAYAEGFFDWREEALADVQSVVSRIGDETSDFALQTVHKLRAKLSDLLETAKNDSKPIERLYEATFRKPGVVSAQLQ